MKAEIDAGELVKEMAREIVRLKAEIKWLYDQLAAQREAYRQLAMRSTENEKEKAS